MFPHIHGCMLMIGKGGKLSDTLNCYGFFLIPLNVLA